MKNIVITGIAQGIGYETTKQFLKDNNKVIGIVRKQADKTRLEKEFVDYNLQVEICDLQKEEDIENFVNNLKKQDEKIDIVINNAGIIGDYTKLITEASDLKTVFATNVFAVQQLVNGLLPLINENGDVISISTGFAHYPNLAKKEAAQYALSKSTLNTLMQIYANTVTDIKFNVLYPGMVQTRIGLPNANRKPQEVYDMITNVIVQSVTGKCFKEFNQIEWLEAVNI